MRHASSRFAPFRGRRPVVLLVAALAGLLTVAGTLQARADHLPWHESPTTTTAPPPPPPEETTTTTAPPAETTTTTAPSGQTTTTTAPAGGESTTTTTTLLPPLGGPSPTAPPGSDAPPATDPAPVIPPGASGDATNHGEGADCGPVCPGRSVPADAQALIDSVRRTPPNDNRVLVEAERAMLAAGVAPDDAARQAYGRFPVAGPAHWVDDWLNPRWTGETFRFHLGLDLVADYGTPLRSPDDGVVRIENSPIAGLGVKVVVPDGSFYFLAHLSGIAEGLTDGAAVRTGDLLGYVGTSGNATGPHLHFGVYERGTRPIPPKPLVDGWVREASDRTVQTLAAHGLAAPRPLLATSLLRDALAGATAGAFGAVGPGGTDVLVAAGGNPAGGGLQVAEAAAAQAAFGVDWVERARRQQAMEAAWDRSADEAWRVLGPLVPAALAQRLTG